MKLDAKNISKVMESTDLVEKDVTEAYNIVSNTLKEFTLIDGKHYKLAMIYVADHRGKSEDFPGYVTVDQKYYTHGVIDTSINGAKLVSQVSLALDSPEGRIYHFRKWA